MTDPDSGLITYYIVKLIDRDPSRMLGADLRYRLLQEAFGSWLKEQEMGATITKFLENQVVGMPVTLQQLPVLPNHCQQ